MDKERKEALARFIYMKHVYGRAERIVRCILKASDLCWCESPMSDEIKGRVDRIRELLPFGSDRITHLYHAYCVHHGLDVRGEDTAKSYAAMKKIDDNTYIYAVSNWLGQRLVELGEPVVRPDFNDSSLINFWITQNGNLGAAHPALLDIAEREGEKDLALDINWMKQYMEDYMPQAETSENDDVYEYENTESVDTDASEYIEGMKEGIIYTDDNHLYSITEVTLLSGETVQYVLTSDDWDSDGDSVKLTPLLEWEDEMNGVYLREFRRPLSGEEAVNAMKEGCKICELIGLQRSDTIYVVRKLPVLMDKGWEEVDYVISISGDCMSPEVDGPLDEFLESYEGEPVFEVMEEED